MHRHFRPPILPSIGLIVLSTIVLGQPANAQQTTDRERIIDIESLTRSVQRATAPVDERLRASKLTEAFAEVSQIMRQPTPDSRQLLSALNTLEAELSRFTDNWDTMTSPLWDAQGGVGKSIDRVRGLLAQGSIGKAPAELARLAENYDRRLEELAVQIEAERDETRRERLRLIFANVLGLKQLTSSVGAVNLGPAREAVFAKVVRALQAVEAQITATCYAMERAKILLDGQREFVGLYRDLLAGIIDAGTLIEWLRGQGDTGADFGSLIAALQSIATLADEFGSMADGHLGTLAAHLEDDAARLGDEVSAQALPVSVNLDAEIAAYRERARSR